MTDIQLYLAIGIPITAVLASLTVSLVQVSGIREDMCELRRDMNAMRTESRSDSQGLATKIDLLTGKVWELMGQK